MPGEPEVPSPEETTTNACLACGKPAGGGHATGVGVVCPSCWELALPEATTRLCDRVHDLLENLHPVSTHVVAQVVEAALPDPEDRLRVWFELGIRGLIPNGQSGRRTLRLLALVQVLRRAGVSLSLRGSPTHGVCGQCLNTRELRGRRKGIPLCGNCWSTLPSLLRPCTRCDDVDYRSSPGRPRLCRECLFHDKIRDVFNQDVLRKQPSLAGARDALLTADTTHWSRFFAGVTTWPLLKRMLAEHDVITHESLDSYGTPDQIKILRSFLVTTGALPVRDERVVALEAWIASTAEQIGHDEDRRSFVRFARWRHLRQARLKDLTDSQLSWRRRELILVSRFLHSLHSSGCTLPTTNQTHVDAWLAAGTKDRALIRPFVHWCRDNAITRIVHLPVLTTSSLPKTAGLAEDHRQRLLCEVLDPAAELDPGLRLAAGLMLVYGSRPHELTGLRLHDIVAGEDTIHIRFGPEPLQLPEALQIPARAAIAARSVARFGGIGEDHEWLFPGPIHGRPITTSTMTRRLRAIGLDPAPARSTAMGQLAMQLPPVILARLTGITVARAAVWHAATSASQARNLPAPPRN
jgi:integrase